MADVRAAALIRWACMAGSRGFKYLGVLRFWTSVQHGLEIMNLFPQLIPFFLNHGVVHLEILMIPLQGGVLLLQSIVLSTEGIDLFQ